METHGNIAFLGILCYIHALTFTCDFTFQIEPCMGMLLDDAYSQSFGHVPIAPTHAAKYHCKVLEIGDNPTPEARLMPRPVFCQ